MKITDLKCAVIGSNPVVRICTDAGICGYGEIESTKPYMKPHVLFYKDYIVGEDPTNVERVMMRIRRMASFKPWGSAVSAIEMARLEESRGSDATVKTMASKIIGDQEQEIAAFNNFLTSGKKDGGGDAYFKQAMSIMNNMGMEMDHSA